MHLKKFPEFFTEIGVRGSVLDPDPVPAARPTFKKARRPKTLILHRKFW